MQFHRSKLFSLTFLTALFASVQTFAAQEVNVYTYDSFSADWGLDRK